GSPGCSTPRHSSCSRQRLPCCTNRRNVLTICAYLQFILHLMLWQLGLLTKFESAHEPVKPEKRNRRRCPTKPGKHRRHTDYACLTAGWNRKAPNERNTEANNSRMPR